MRIAHGQRGDVQQDIGVIAQSRDIRHLAWIEPCVVTRAAEGDVSPTVCISDPSGVLHTRYGATQRCAYLIRPDGYVAARALGWSGLVDGLA